MLYLIPTNILLLLLRSNLITKLAALTGFQSDSMI